MSATNKGKSGNALGNVGTDALPIIKRGNRYILQKTFKGVGQKQVPLGADYKTALTRAKRFMAVAEANGYETALEQLQGKKVVLRGTDPTFEEMKLLYMDFLKQSAKKHDPRTIKTNINRLKNVMDRCGFKTVGTIDKTKIFTKWFENVDPTDSQRRTFYSAIRAAASIFKKRALEYYETRNLKIANPFTGIDLDNPKVQPYHPITDKLRETIWNDCENELPADQAMIVLMALGIGLRREEIEAARAEWVSVSGDTAFITIKEYEEFNPKAHEKGIVPFSKELYERLLKLRGKSDSGYFVPYSEKAPTDRLFTPATKVCDWLRKKGISDDKPIHALRKEAGSIIAKLHGTLEASKILRNNPVVCARHYVGIAETNPIDIGASFQKPKTPIELLAEQMGITVEELQKKLQG